jgi:hypothetical protein
VPNADPGLGWLALHPAVPYAPDHEPENGKDLANCQYGELIDNASVGWEEQRYHADAQPANTADDKEDAKNSGNELGSIYKNPER